MEMKDLLKQGITEALNKAMDKGTLPAGDYPSVALEVPPQKEFGDFAAISPCSRPASPIRPRNSLLRPLSMKWIILGWNELKSPEPAS